MFHAKVKYMCFLQMACSSSLAFSFLCSRSICLMCILIECSQAPPGLGAQSVANTLSIAPFLVAARCYSQST